LVIRSWAFSGWTGAEILVLEAVGVPLQVEDLGVVDEPVDHCRGDDLVAEDLGEKGLFEVTIIEARS
jgi:hypothetical protein